MSAAKRKKTAVFLSAVMSLAVMLCAVLIISADNGDMPYVALTVTIDGESVKNSAKGTSALDAFIAGISKEGISATFFIDLEGFEYNEDFVYAMILLRVNGYLCGVENWEKSEHGFDYIKLSSNGVTNLAISGESGRTPKGTVDVMPDIIIRSPVLLDKITEVQSGASVNIKIDAQNVPDYIEHLSALKKSGIGIGCLSASGTIIIPASKEE